MNLQLLHQHSSLSNPMEAGFDYAKEFKSLDLDAVIKDLHALMTDSQDWWPADFGHYGPLFVRMAWHAAGTYRIGDGRGGAGTGQQRFAPTDSWPDNANLDKARRLLWPIKQKYGRRISWADLLILTGNVALESMGFKTFGFGGGRADVWEPDESVYWDPEGKWLADDRDRGERNLENPLAAVQMGRIYVNPEGPNGKPAQLAKVLTALEAIQGEFNGSGSGAKRVSLADLIVLGGCAAIGRAAKAAGHGIFTKRPETLTNDFFVNLLDMGTQWQPSASTEGVYEGSDRKTSQVKWTGTRVDLIFGSHSQLRALAEVYACADSKEKFVKDFVAAWTKVMNLDRFERA